MFGPTYDERTERSESERRRHEATLDRDVRHAPAPDWPGPAPRPPAGWRSNGRGGIEPIDPSVRGARG